MSKEDKIETLQGWVGEKYIIYAKDLKDTCRHEKEASGVDIDWFDDILCSYGMELLRQVWFTRRQYEPNLA